MNNEQPLPLESLCEFFGLSLPVLRRRINEGKIRLKTFSLHSGKKAKPLVSPKEWARFLKEREKDSI